MANWTETYIALSGTELEEARKIFNSEKIVNEYGEWVTDDTGRTMILNDVDIKDGALHISGSGRNAAPDRYFVNLCERFDLDMYFFDAEAGSNYTKVIVMENGIVLKSGVYDYFCNESIKVLGVEYFLSHFSGISDEDGWEEKHKEKIELFSKHGIDVKELGALLSAASIPVIRVIRTIDKEKK